MGDLQDPEKFKSRMHSLAYGQAMAAAARDYQKVRCTCRSALGCQYHPCNQDLGQFPEAGDLTGLCCAGDAGRVEGFSVE